MVGGLGERAVVAGAGIGGLIATGVLSKFFSEVVLIEKDALPKTAELRKGVPQDSQIHIMLKGGEDAFESVFPGFCKQLADAGATPLEFGKDIYLYEGGRAHAASGTGIIVHSQTRPVFEWVARRMLSEIPNVLVRDQTRILEISLTPDGAVDGLIISDDDGRKDTLQADLLVDAMGRSGFTARWLAKTTGVQVPASRIGIDLVYASALLRRTAPWRGRNYGWAIRPTAPANTKSGVLIPVEGERWIMTLSGRFGDVPPDDPAGFMAYAGALEDKSVYEQAKDAEFETAISIYRIPEMIWRHYDKIVDFPDRLIPLGDTVAGFNPLAAQGMSMAALHALALRDSLQTGLAGATEAYMAKAMAIAGDAWSLGELIDLAYPQARAERPENLQQRFENRAAVLKLAATDGEVRRLVFEVQNMLRPASDLQDTALLARAFAI